MDYYTSIEQFPVILSAEDLAKALNVSISTSYRLLHSKGFPVVTIGKRRMVSKNDLVKWIKQQTVCTLN